MATAFNIDPKEIPKRFGRRKLKALYSYLGQVENLHTLRSAVGTRAAMGADKDGFEKYADSLMGDVSTPVESEAPVVDMEREAARVDNDGDYEVIDDG